MMELSNKYILSILEFYQKSAGIYLYRAFEKTSFRQYLRYRNFSMQIKRTMGCYRLREYSTISYMDIFK